MSGILTQLVVTFIAVLAATFILPEIGFPDLRYSSLTDLAIFAAVLAILNAVVRPVVKVLTCPINIMTLGLFTLVINAIMFILADRLVQDAFAGPALGFVSAFVAALVVSVVSTLAGLFVDND